MAPRRTSKTAKNVTEGMDIILSTEPLKTIDEAAEFVGISGFELQEKFAEILNLPQALTWQAVPHEYDNLLIDFKAQVNGVEVMPDTTSETFQTDEVKQETAMTEKTPQTGGKMTSKSKTAGITNKRKKSIEKQLENIDTIDLGIDQADALNLVRDAAADGVELGQAQILAKEAARASVRRKAHERTTAKLKGKAIQRANYNPTDLLEQAGVKLSDELLGDLQSFSELSLGKLETVFQEVTGDVWANGYNNDFSDLDELLNSNE